jgi:spore coat protein JB
MLNRGGREMSETKCKDLLRKIQELEFAAVDINLYLDNHPENQKALNDYNRISEELKQLKRVYEKEFGPLMPFGNVPAEYPWNWINDPWPWEQE